MQPILELEHNPVVKGMDGSHSMVYNSPPLIVRYTFAIYFLARVISSVHCKWSGLHTPGWMLTLNFVSKYSAKS